MGEDEVVYSEVLVATVGLNPLPVALSLVTLRPSRVVLLCSRQSQREARRIQEVVSRVAKRLDSTWVPVFETPKPIDVDQLGTCLDGVKAAMAALSPPFRLEYSGGTKMMTVAAVVAHIERHAHCPDTGAQWRTVVDDAAGRVYPGARAVPARETADVLTLEDVVALHGYYMKAGQPLDLSSIPDHTAAIAELFAALADLDGPAMTTLTDAPSLIATCARGIGVTMKSSGDIGDARGKLRELLVAHVALQWVRNNPGMDVSEIWFGAEPAEAADGDGTVEEGRKAELDLVMRAKHRTLAIEVKSSAEKARTFIAERLIPSRWPFGDAVTTAIAGAQGRPHDDSGSRTPPDTCTTAVAEGRQEKTTVQWSAVTKAAKELQDSLPALSGKAYAWRIEQPRHRRAPIDEVTGGLTAWLTPKTEDPGPPPTPLPTSATGSAVVFAADGTPLIVQHTLYFSQQHDLAVGLGRQTGQAAYRRAVKDANVPQENWKNCHYLGTGPTEEDAYQSLVGLPHTVTPQAVVVSPGPKVVTAGLIRFAWERKVDIVHLALDGRVTTRSPDGTLSVSVSDFEPTWETVLRGYANPSTDWEIDWATLTEEQRAIASRLLDSGSVTVFAAAGPAFGHDRIEHPPLVLAGPRGCLSMHQYPKPCQTPNSKGRSSFRTQLRAEVMYLSTQVGDAYKPLVISGDPAGLPTLKPYVAHERWLPILTTQYCTEPTTDGDTDWEKIVLHLVGRR